MQHNHSGNGFHDNCAACWLDQLMKTKVPQILAEDEEYLLQSTPSF